MVFSAALPGSYLLSLCTICVLIACFLLYFCCRPHGYESAWNLSYCRSYFESTIHMLLFCFLGMLGSAWALQIHHVAALHASDHAGAAPGAHASDAAHAPNATAHAPHLAVLSAGASAGAPRETCYVNQILVLSAAGFLCVSACSTINNRDPPAPAPRLGPLARCATRLLAGGAIVGVGAVDCDHTYLLCVSVAAVMLTCALVELWGVQPKSAQ